MEVKEVRYYLNSKKGSYENQILKGIGKRTSTSEVDHSFQVVLTQPIPNSTKSL